LNAPAPGKAFQTEEAEAQMRCVSAPPTVPRSVFADRLRKIDNHRKELIKALVPCGDDYSFGGSHRCWVKETARLTTVAYISDCEKATEAMAECIRENPADFPQYVGRDIALSLVRHIAIPMPPAWNGVRPAEIVETYGHPHLPNKDWRAFENTLRYTFADKGWICRTAMLNGYKEIVFTAIKMKDLALTGLDTAVLDESKYEGKVPKDKAEIGDVPYDVWCANLDAELADAPSNERRLALADVPYALRPIVAMAMNSNTPAPAPPTDDDPIISQAPPPPPSEDEDPTA